MKPHVSYGGDFSCRHLQHVVKILDTIREHGGEIDRVVKAKHVKIYYRAANGTKLMYVTGLSPSDQRMEKNALGDVRRDLRQNAKEAA